MLFNLLTIKIIAARFRNFALLITLSLEIIACQSIQSNSEEDNKNLLALNSRIAIATDYIDQGKPALALADLRLMLREYPEMANVVALNAVAHLALNNFSKAISLQKKAYELEPTTAMGVTLGGVLIAGNRLNEAETLLLKLEKDSAYASPERLFLNLGYLYEKKGKFPAAIKRYKQALEVNPTYFPAMSQLGRVHEKVGDHKSATIIYRKANSLCPLCFEPVNLLYQHYAAQKQMKPALELLDNYLKSTELSPENRKLALKLKKEGTNLKTQQAKSTPSTPKSKG
jgi:Tfp pilus assembly protein PilF